jgi:hypothetical protein
MNKKRSVYDYKRYWYHLSLTLKNKEYCLVPWDNDKGFNRSDDEPNIERICVSPSIAHCLTAIPYSFSDTYNIYRTKNCVKVKKPFGNVFDSHITKEGWLLNPTNFIKIGTLTLANVDNNYIIDEAATSGDSKMSKKVLKWWQKINLHRYIKRV